MNSVFRSVPNDSDTEIRFSEILRLVDLEVLWQNWVWAGIRADSLIFCPEDAERYTEDELIKFAETSSIWDKSSKMTTSRTSGFAFVNMNFEEL